MHYLIDGHNLIGQLPDISLEDPDDEVALVLRLRRWAARGRKRRVTLVFDRGLPGGQDKGLSTGNIEVVFASGGQPADALLIARIQRVKNPRDYTLVSSDRRILQRAQARRMPVWRAEEFAERVTDELADGRTTAVATAAEPQLSADEIDQWLRLFGEEDAQHEVEKKRRPRNGPPKA